MDASGQLHGTIVVRIEYHQTRIGSPTRDLQDSIKSVSREDPCTRLAPGTASDGELQALIRSDSSQQHRQGRFLSLAFHDDEEPQSSLPSNI